MWVPRDVKESLVSRKRRWRFALKASHMEMPGAWHVLHQKVLVEYVVSFLVVSSSEAFFSVCRVLPKVGLNRKALCKYCLSLEMRKLLIFTVGSVVSREESKSLGSNLYIK